MERDTHVFIQVYFRNGQSLVQKSLLREFKLHVFWVSRTHEPVPLAYGAAFAAFYDEWGALIVID
jgi:hypothetical protein